MNKAAEQQQVLLTEVLEKPGTALSRLIDLYRRTYEGLLENRDLFEMIHKIVFGPPQGIPHYDIEQYHRRMVDTIKVIYQEGLSSNEVKEADPEAVSMLVLSILDFCFHFDQVHPERMDLERPEHLLTLAFQGLAREEDG